MMLSEPSISFGPTLWPTKCAWCQAEGKSTIVGWSTVKNSHGICKLHLEELLAKDAEDINAEEEA